MVIRSANPTNLFNPPSHNHQHQVSKYTYIIEPFYLPRDLSRCISGGEVWLKKSGIDIPELLFILLIKHQNITDYTQHLLQTLEMTCTPKANSCNFLSKAPHIRWLTFADPICYHTVHHQK